MPPTGSVKIIPKKVSEGPKKVQWLWTILGDRNWSGSSVSPDQVTVFGSFPLNSLTRTGGTHVWELWITATSAEAGGQSTISAEVKIRGSNGAGVTSTRSIEKTTVSNAFKPIMLKSDTFRLPTEIDIAEVGGKTLKLAVKD